MSPDGDDPVIGTGGKDSIIQVWNPTVDSIDRSSIQLPTTEVRSLDVYQGSRVLAVIGTKDGKVFVWDLKENVEVVRFAGHTASVHCVCIANTASDLEDMEDDINHLCIASGGADRVVRTWDLHTGKRIRKFRHQRSISSMVVSKREERPLLATAGVERQIKLWDLNTGILLRTLVGHLDQINCLSIWEGCQILLISGSSDRTVRVFDMLTGECVCSLVGHRDAVLSVTVTDFEFPKLVSSSEDLSLIQWDLHEIIGHFYHTKGELNGLRNKKPSFLPSLEYEAPEELDRATLSKEERKRIRKERKKQQRIKNLLNDWTAPTGEPEEKTKDKDKDKDRRRDQQDQDDEDNDRAVGMGSESQRAGRDEDEDDLPGLDDMGEEELEDEDYADLLQSLALRDKVDEEDRPPMPEAEGKEAAEEKAADDEEPRPSEPVAAAESKELERSASAKALHSLGRASQIFVGKLLSSALTRVAPESPLRPTSSSASLRRDRSQPAVGVITETATPNVMKSLGKALGLGSNTVAVEVPAQQQLEQEEAEEKAEPLTPLPSASAKEAKAEDEAGPCRKTTAVQKEENFKALAAAAQNKYNIATVEHQLAADRQKKKAAANLQARLNSRKNQAQSSEDKSADELHELKAEKLRQHKLQESRRRESMAVAKARSANALQKRLEELAKKKSGNQDNQITAITEDGEDSDNSNAD
jgi:WD40 repeat protein